MMNLRRILLASGAQLLESSRRICTRAAAPGIVGGGGSVQEPPPWLRDFPYTRVNGHLYGDLKGYKEREKKKLFVKLWNLSYYGLTVEETIDQFISGEKKKRDKMMRVSITKADLLHWAKHLNKECKHQDALEIFEWMEGRNRMSSFTGKQLALYVSLIYKTKGFTAAYGYFKKVDPNFNYRDNNAKNMPAYAKLWALVDDAQECSPTGIRYLVKGG